MTAGVEVLMVPGFTGSGPHHWQSLWQRDDPAFRRVEQRDWDRPEPREWTRALEPLPFRSVVVASDDDPADLR